MRPCETGATANQMHRADLEILGRAMKAFVASGASGVAAFFVYGMDKDSQQEFWAFACDLAARSEMHPAWLRLAPSRKSLR